MPIYVIYIPKNAKFITKSIFETPFIIFYLQSRQQRLSIIYNYALNKLLKELSIDIHSKCVVLIYF